MTIKLELLILKYLAKSASDEDLSQLEKLIVEDESKNLSVFEDYIRTDYLINASLVKFDSDSEKRKILKRIQQTRKSHTRRIYKYVALLILLIGTSYLIYQNLRLLSVNPDQNIVLQSDIIGGNENTILTLENGDIIPLAKNTKLSINGIVYANGKLIYENLAGEKKDVPKYHYLTIPRGGQFFVQLSDGTEIWLNSDSKLKYPVHFIEGRTRKVELLYGEAYFIVTNDNSRNGFQVNTNIQKISVLGTEFNVKSYESEGQLYTTLVEGKLAISNGIITEFLEPYEQSIVDFNNSELKIVKVDDIFNEVAWKEGFFSFKSKSMKEIMDTLSRWYDADYEFKNADKMNLKFTGVLNRENSIDYVLDYIQKTNEIKFEIRDKTVIIE